MRIRRFSPVFLERPPLTWADGLILVAIAVVLYAGAQLAFNAPAVVTGPEISLSPRALPWYAFLSTGRMAAAYVLSLAFSLPYAYAARRKAAGQVLLPILDILQSVPILSFLPVVLLGLTAILPQGVATELSAIVLIFTSQVWNLTFSFYQSLTTLPHELREAAAIFRFDPWQRFKTVELPFAAVGLIWNSIMSWAGGWFFLMAAEIFTVGDRDFRLAGLGAYLQVAADRGDAGALASGLIALVAVIVLLDQLFWRPLLAWADKYRLETVSGDEPPSSWFFDALSRSWLVAQFRAKVWEPLSDRMDEAFRRRLRFEPDLPEAEGAEAGLRPAAIAVRCAVALGLLYGGYRVALFLSGVPLGSWVEIGLGVAGTFVRVTAALGIALAWTIPAGVLIGTNRRAAAFFQPVVQVLASIPATALFPVVLLFFLKLPRGLDLAAVALMLMGTQWYLLFNVIAGAAAIPQELRDTTQLLRLSRWDRWRTLVLPALFPYLVTGGITATGGAWNASIVAEHVQFGGEVRATTGIGAVIARATSAGAYAELLAGTLVLILTVVLLNRFFWRRLYRLAEERFRME